MMTKTFKYLRIALAIILPLYCIGVFLKDIIFQIQFKGFDGPLAHYISYTFASNKILLASFLSIVLLFDFTLRLPIQGKLLIKVIGMFCVLISLVGLFFFIRHIIYVGFFFEKEFISSEIQLLLFQLAYLTASIVLLGKAFDKDWHLMNYKSKQNA